MQSGGLTRRYFFFGSLLAGAVPSGGYGSVKSLKSLGYRPANGRLNVAAIGCGGRGGELLSEVAETENIVALCDVDEARAAPNFTRYAGTPRYSDYRVMLDREGDRIDACTIAIPDQMHASAALACMQRGKHVYLEKPLTRTPWEARLLTDAAVQYDVATQMGNQAYSHEINRVAAEILWSGEIGNVTEVHASCDPGTHPVALAQEPRRDMVPSGLDWDLWLGRAESRTFSRHYVPYNWRGFFDFGTGQLGNWGVHVFGPVNLALRLGAPTSVEALQVQGPSPFSFPRSAVLKYEFPARGEMPAVNVFWHDSALAHEPEAYRVPGMENETILPLSDNLTDKGRPTKGGPRVRPLRDPFPRRTRGRSARSPGGSGIPVFGAERRRRPFQPGVLTGNGAVFIGDKGIMATAYRGEGVHLLPSSRWADYELPPPTLPRSSGHMEDWLLAAKGGPPPASNFSVSGPYTEWLVLGVIAYRVPGKLEWDSANLRFTNSEEANRYVTPTFRPGWELSL